MGGSRFDGDGMMHVVRIKDGKASYCNRFVDTLQLQQAKLAGHPVGIKVRFAIEILKQISSQLTSPFGRGTKCVLAAQLFDQLSLTWLPGVCTSLFLPFEVLTRPSLSQPLLFDLLACVLVYLWPQQVQC